MMEGALKHCPEGDREERKAGEQHYVTQKAGESMLYSGNHMEPVRLE